MANFTDVELVSGGTATALVEAASGGFVGFDRSNAVSYHTQQTSVVASLEETVFANYDHTDVFFISLNVLSGTPPSLTGLVPADGSFVRPTDSISFTVAFPEDEVRTIVAAKFDNIGRTELVHDGDQFYPPYAALSSVVNNAQSRDYVIRRDPEWYDAPKLLVYSVDALAQEL